MSYWIVFEGLDGCGKSTQARLLAERLDALPVREPGGTSLGAALRMMLLNTPADPWVQALLFAADRAQLLTERVLPTLESGRVVVSDRSVYSSLAYQGASGLDEGRLRELNTAVFTTRSPDVVVYLRVSPQTSLARRAGRDADVIESRGIEYLSAVAARFEDLAAREGFLVLDAEIEPDALADAVFTAVQERCALPDASRR